MISFGIQIESFLRMMSAIFILRNRNRYITFIVRCSLKKYADILYLGETLRFSDFAYLE